MIRLLILAALLCAIANLPADAFLLIGPVTPLTFSFPYQVNVTDTLQTAGTLPFQVGKP